ncbi:MAG: hypothetical protein ACUVXI_13420 [bacterium]
MERGERLALFSVIVNVVLVGIKVSLSLLSGSGRCHPLVVGCRSLGSSPGGAQNSQEEIQKLPIRPL